MNLAPGESVMSVGHGTPGGGTVSEDLRIQTVDVRVYTVPTEAPEADGTLEWDKTSYVVVQPTLHNGVVGLGYAVADMSTGVLARDTLADLLVGRDVRDTTASWEAMVRRIHNLGRPGIASMAIAALDIALWDTKARALDLPLHRLLGPVRDAVPVYGSGGFTSYTEAELCAQLAGWVEQGIPRVKMKVGKDRGRSWKEDIERVRAVRLRSATTLSSSSTPTGPTTASRRCVSAESTARSSASAGSRNR